MTEPHETFTWYDDKWLSTRNRRIAFIRHAMIGLALVIVWGGVIWMIL